jgi:hypothetical protein
MFTAFYGAASSAFLVGAGSPEKSRNDPHA